MTARIERCPLGCGAPWHGLPRTATYQTTHCPGPFGVPAPSLEVPEDEGGWVR
jgi:hypothetical protein